MGHNPWGRKKSDTTERLHFLSFCTESIWVKLVNRKLGLCTPLPNQIPETRVRGEAGKDSFIALPGDGRHTLGFCLENLCLKSRELNDGFYNSRSNVGSLKEMATHSSILA